MKLFGLVVVSGGQRGIDRAALEAARDAGCITGGFAPLGYRTRGGDDPSLQAFGLVEMQTRSYIPRTRANVRASSLTLLLCQDRESPGTHATIEACRLYKKPYYPSTIHADMSEKEILALSRRLARFLVGSGVLTCKAPVINVAGNSIKALEPVAYAALLPVFSRFS